MPAPKKTTAFHIALIYFLFSVAWIFFSDFLLEERFSHDPDLLTTYQTFKGWFYITLTSLLIFWLVARECNKQTDIYNELAQSEQKFRILVEQSLTGVYILQEEGFIYINPKFQEITGYSLDELADLSSFLDSVHEEDREQVRKNIQKRLRGELAAIQYVFRFWHKGGRLVYIEVHGTRAEWEGNAVVIGTILNITNRKLAENELRMFRQIIERTNDTIEIIDPETSRYLDINEKACQELGYTREELLELSVIDIDPKVNLEVFRENVDRIRREGSLLWESYHQRKDGSVFPVEVNVKLVQIEREYLVAVVRDLSERKRLEKNLLLNKFAMDKTRDAIYWINPDASFFYVNDAACQMLGYKQDEVQSMTVLDIDPDVDEQAWSSIWKLLLKERSMTMESRHLTREGRVFPIEVRAYLVEYEGVMYDCAIVRDITERKRREQEEHELKERLQIAISAGLVGLWDWDLQTDKVYYSPEWKLQIGYRNDEIGDDFNEWKSRVHPEELDVIMEKINAFIEGELPEFFVEFRFRHKDGSWRWILGRGDLKYDEDNRPVRMSGTHIDITHLKESEMAIRESKERLNYLLISNPTILFALKPDGKNLNTAWVSENVTRILGYSLKEVKQPDWWPAHIHPEDRDQCYQYIQELLDKNHFVHEYRFAHRDGQYLWIREELRVIRDELDQPVEIIGAWSDITKQRREEERVRFYATAFESTADGVIITDTEGRIEQVNRAFMKITGYSEHEVLGKNPSLLKSGRQDDEYYRNMWNSLQQNGFWQGEIWNRRKSGEVYPEWLTISAVRNRSGVPCCYVGVFTDISKLKRTENELERLAHYDMLTNLPNRLLLQLRLEHAIDRAARHDQHVGVLFVDLDDFKKVNDSLGHTVGDELLAAVSERLQKRVRREDTLGRLGGDEFLIVIEDLGNTEDITMLASQILDQLRQPFHLESGYEIYVEACIGISIYPNDGKTVEVLLRNADTAMYQAKERGRNKFCYFTSDMNMQAVEMLDLETALHQGIRNDEFLFHYQPKVDLKTGRITGAEALIRWQHNNELISPGRFIPLAERTGMIIPIGEWAVRTACRQIRSWIDSGVGEVGVTVNISVRQFRQRDLGELVRNAMEEAGIRPGLLGLEITESALMEHPEEAMEILHPLKQLGVQISLDDFGTGFSNMAYLIKFPIDVLKIDTTFIKNIETDPNAVKLVNSIIDLAKSLNLKTVAEGVETVYHMDFLRKHFCNEMQGFYFSKAVPPDDFERMLREGKSIEFSN